MHSPHGNEVQAPTVIDQSNRSRPNPPHRTIAIVTSVRVFQLPRLHVIGSAGPYRGYVSLSLNRFRGGGYGTVKVRVRVLQFKYLPIVCPRLYPVRHPTPPGHLNPTTSKSLIVGHFSPKPKTPDRDILRLHHSVRPYYL
jgi:hypothetical protein